MVHLLKSLPELFFCPSCPSFPLFTREQRVFSPVHKCKSWKCQDALEGTGWALNLVSKMLPPGQKQQMNHPKQIRGIYFRQKWKNVHCSGIDEQETLSLSVSNRQQR